MARKIDALLAAYGESHQNPTNKLVHWVCVPVIFWTIVALLWAIPVPDGMAAVPFLNWATVALGLAKVEGKKPNFFKDVQFLLIGPAWLIGFVYKRLGVRY